MRNVHQLRGRYSGPVANQESNFERGGRIVNEVLADTRNPLEPSEMLQVALIDTLRAVVDELSKTREELAEIREVVAAVPALTTAVKELHERMGLAA